MKRQRLRKLPGAVENLLSRSIKTDGVVPALGDGDAVGRLPIPAPELDVDEAISILLPGDAVDRVGIVLVLLVVTLRVVDADGPEGIDGDVLDTELVSGLTIVPR